MISGVGVAAVRTGSVVIGPRMKTGGVNGLKRMSCDELEGSGLVQAGVGGKNSVDEVGDGKTRGFPEWGKRWGSPGRGVVQVLLHSSSRRSDRGKRACCGHVRVAWNVSSTPG